MLKLTMMLPHKGDKAHGFWPDVAVHEKMGEAVHVGVVHTTDGCDVVEVLPAVLLADGSLM